MCFIFFVTEGNHTANSHLKVVMTNREAVIIFHDFLTYLIKSLLLEESHFLLALFFIYLLYIYQVINVKYAAYSSLEKSNIDFIHRII